MGKVAEELRESHDQSMEFGYEEKLYRGMNELSSFAFAFTSVAVVSSVSGVYPTAIAIGGPAVFFWSWILVSILTMFVAFSMAEISSAYPSVLCN